MSDDQNITQEKLEKTVYNAFLARSFNAIAFRAITAISYGTTALCTAAGYVANGDGFKGAVGGVLASMAAQGIYHELYNNRKNNAESVLNDERMSFIDRNWDNLRAKWPTPLHYMTVEKAQNTSMGRVADIGARMPDEFRADFRKAAYIAGVRKTICRPIVAAVRAIRHRAKTLT